MKPLIYFVFVGVGESDDDREELLGVAKDVQKAICKHFTLSYFFSAAN